MKKLLIMLSFVMFTVSAFAQTSVGLKPWNYVPPAPAGQFQAQSLALSSNATNLSVLYLSDGLSNSYTAIATPLFQITGLPAKVGLFAVGAVSMSSPKLDVYAGTALGVQVFSTANSQAILYAGVKGLNITTMSFDEGKAPFLVGIGVNFKL